MGWLIGIVIGYFAGVGLNYLDEKRGLAMWANDAAIFLTLITALFWGFIGGMVAGLESGSYHHEEDRIANCRAEEIKTPIISVERNKDISSSFILGTGGTSTIDKYYAYVEREHGLRLETFYPRKTYIVETDYEGPYYRRVDYLCERTFRNWFWFGTDGPRRNEGKWVQLHVPKDTILRKFTL